MPLLAARFLIEARTPLEAYLNLQRTLMARHIARGGSAQDWCERLAPAFRTRYQCMLEELRSEGW